jgi:hypothetical protein
VARRASLSTRSSDRTLPIRFPATADAYIEGDSFALMGLPVVRMLALIERFGWRYGFGRLERKA